MITPATRAIENDDPPPNRLYANRHAEAIRWHHDRGMNRRTLETIYGRGAVDQILGPSTVSK